MEPTTKVSERMASVNVTISTLSLRSNINSNTRGGVVSSVTLAARRALPSVVAITSLP